MSRNPTYAAINFLIVPALGLCSVIYGSFLLPANMIAFYFVLIRDEESYLQTFGSEWDRYLHNQTMDLASH
jgi:protein-S-isoprenylcysteine O-methyltransferase Ste14